MGRRKAGMCKCGHELRRFHDDAGVCTYGAGGNFAGACERDYGGPCSKPRRKRSDAMPVKKTRAVTIEGEKILDALDNIIIGFQVLRAAVAQAKTSGPLPSGLGSYLAVAPTVEKQVASPTARDRVDVATPSRRAEVPKSAASARGEVELAAGPRAVLMAIAQWRNPTAEVLVIATGYRSTSVQTYLGELSQLAYITREGGRAQITGDGLDALGLLSLESAPETRPTKKDLLERWIRDLPEGPSNVLRAIAESEDATATQSEIVAALAQTSTPYKATSVQTYLGELSNAKVIKRGGGCARLHPELGGPS